MQVNLKKRAVHRARIIEGQMRSLSNAIQEEKYCVDILVQSLAIQKSLQSLGSFVLENHVRTHLKHQLQNPKQENQAVQELLRIYSLSR